MSTNTTDTTAWLKALHGSPLSPGARHLGYELALALEDGRYPSDSELGERLGRTRRTIIRYRDELRRDGFLDWEIRRGEVNAYALKTPPVWNLTPPTPSTCDTDGPVTCDTVGALGDHTPSAEAGNEASEPVTPGDVEPVTSGAAPDDEAGVTCDIAKPVSQVPKGWKRLWAWVSGGAPVDACHPPIGLLPTGVATHRTKPLAPQPLAPQPSAEPVLCFIPGCEDFALDHGLCQEHDEHGQHGQRQVPP